MVAVVFSFVILIIIGGGMLLARLITVAKSKHSWIWGFFILILLICIPLFLLGIGAYFVMWFLGVEGGFGPIWKLTVGVLRCPEKLAITILSASASPPPERRDTLQCGRASETKNAIPLQPLVSLTSLCRRCRETIW